MTPFGLLNFFADARGLSAHRKNERIEAVIDICRLEGVVYKPIAKLSKGYRQRVGMAQTLLHEPDVLIMDEPTAGLDPNQIREVREVLKRLSREKTILLSAHILQEVEAMASRVIMINEGGWCTTVPLDLGKQARIGGRVSSLDGNARRGGVLTGGAGRLGQDD
jgi:ABC-2 type transport system ATP-binding protein